MSASARILSLMSQPPMNNNVAEISTKDPLWIGSLDLSEYMASEREVRRFFLNFSNPFENTKWGI